jgi:excisionase family DNA binding protein
VPPYVAAFILREISGSRWRSAIDGARATNPQLATQLERAQAYLRDGREWHRDAVRQATSVRGNAETEIVNDDGDSDRPPPSDTDVVAGQLGVSARQVRNLCKSEALRATRVGRNWAIDPTSVEEYAMRNAQ